MKKRLDLRRKSDDSTKIILKSFNDHEKLDEKRYKELHGILKEIPKTEEIATMVADAVKVTVNGKIDKIALHLGEQDEKMKELSEKIQPASLFRTIGLIFLKGIVFAGAVAGALYAFIKLAQALGIIK